MIKRLRANIGPEDVMVSGGFISLMGGIWIVWGLPAMLIIGGAILFVGGILLAVVRNRS